MHSGEEFRSARQAHNIDSSLRVRGDRNPSPTLTFSNVEKNKTQIVQCSSTEPDLIDLKSPISFREMKEKEINVKLSGLIETLKLNFSRQLQRFRFIALPLALWTINGPCNY